MKTQDGESRSLNSFRNLISNVGEVSWGRLRVDSGPWVPWTTQTNMTGCSLGSPVGHYLRYARHELTTSDVSTWVKRLATGLLPFLEGVLVALGVGKVAHFGEYLVSTNPRTSLLGLDLEALTRAMVGRFPGHAVAIRTVRPPATDGLYERLEALGYRMLINREVFLFDPEQLASRPRKTRRRVAADRLLFRQWRENFAFPAKLGAEEYNEIARLYQDIYRRKHSPLNPGYSAQWFHRGVQLGLMDLGVLRDEGRIQAFIACSKEPGPHLAPLVLGYREQWNDGKAYRLLWGFLLEKAVTEDRTVHFSSGASQFKLYRGCTREFEYEAVSVSHLGPRRRFGWALLRRTVNGIAPRLYTQGFV